MCRITDEMPPVAPAPPLPPACRAPEAVGSARQADQLVHAEHDEQCGRTRQQHVRQPGPLDGAAELPGRRPVGAHEVGDQQADACQTHSSEEKEVAKKPTRKDVETTGPDRSRRSAPGPRSPGRTSPGCASAPGGPIALKGCCTPTTPGARPTEESTVWWSAPT